MPLAVRSLELAIGTSEPDSLYVGHVGSYWSACIDCLLDIYCWTTIRHESELTIRDLVSHPAYRMIRHTIRRVSLYNEWMGRLRRGCLRVCAIYLSELLGGILLRQTYMDQ
jgi:hypothetical protein